MKRILFITLLISIQNLLIAQENWQLSKCVNYAIENNIDLSRAYNRVAEQEINHLQSMANVLPSLNLGSNANMNFGRGIDGNNAVTFDQIFTNNYWIESSISLFQGLVKYNSIAFNSYLLSAQEQNAIEERNRLVFKVMTAYYSALYSDGLSLVAQKKVDLSHMQFTRMQKLVDVGKESPITVQQLKSQWAYDKLNLTLAKNNATNTLLSLKQLLRFDAKQIFILDTLDINSLVINPTANVDSVFYEAVAILPEIKQQKYLLNASEKDLAIAKGGISPRLSLSAGYNTRYDNGDSITFNNQIKNNQNRYVAMNISIPVFNGASTYSRIKRKQIALIDQKLQLEKQKDDLYSEIWKAVTDLQSAQNEYEASIELHDFSNLNLQNITKKLEKGMASPTDYESAKQQFASAEASLLKAKLIYQMRNQMLKFYMTGNWEHL
ncbi:MAG: TolC family protein [Salinivirgaceae bacterium]|jgi:outer membrane protein|nr:TolC family protein [Salinivirgaceae bacterium]